MGTSTSDTIGWLGIVRLGLVQAAIGAIVVLTTSTLNRVMVVELALPALLPGLLVGLHYLVQVARPRMGHGSDVGGRRTPWIIGGMAVLGLGGILAAGATWWMAHAPVAGIVLAFAAFALIGLGVSACGTSLLVLLAKRVAPPRRAAAATVVWVMMIVGFIVTATTAGHLLDPYTPLRLLVVVSGVALLAFLVTVLALYRLEPRGVRPDAPGERSEPVHRTPFRQALAQVWAEPVARRFTVFVFLSMLAYSAQDLILEPFAGTVYGYTPGESTRLSGVHHGGVLLGMVVVAIVGTRWAGRAVGSLRGWMAGGCLASGLALAALALGGLIGPQWPLKPNVFLLGVANGAFSIAAIASMMRLAGEGRQAREGVRMGLWGAAQAMAFGLGGLVGTAASDIFHWLVGASGQAYAAVFTIEAALFVWAAVLALQLRLSPGTTVAHAGIAGPAMVTRTG